MTRIAILAAIALVSSSSAFASEFSGKCTDYKAKGKEACVSTQWCRWSERKAITLPNGKVTPASGFCSFKPGLKQEWARS